MAWTEQTDRSVVHFYDADANRELAPIAVEADADPSSAPGLANFPAGIVIAGKATAKRVQLVNGVPTVVQEVSLAQRPPAPYPDFDTSRFPPGLVAATSDGLAVMMRNVDISSKGGQVEVYVVDDDGTPRSIAGGVGDEDHRMFNEGARVAVDHHNNRIVIDWAWNCGMMCGIGARMDVYDLTTFDLITKDLKPTDIAPDEQYLAWSLWYDSQGRLLTGGLVTAASDSQKFATPEGAGHHVAYRIENGVMTPLGLEARDLQASPSGVLAYVRRPSNGGDDTLNLVGLDGRSVAIADDGGEPAWQR